MTSRAELADFVEWVDATIEACQKSLGVPLSRRRRVWKMTMLGLLEWLRAQGDRDLTRVAVFDRVWSLTSRNAAIVLEERCAEYAQRLWRTMRKRRFRASSVLARARRRLARLIAPKAKPRTR